MIAGRATMTFSQACHSALASVVACVGKGGDWRTERRFASGAILTNDSWWARVRMEEQDGDWTIEAIKIQRRPFA